MKKLTIKKQLCPIAIAISFALGSPMSVTAEEKATEEEKGNRIIVTANKKAVYLQDIPSSVQSLTSDVLEAMGADAFEDYSRGISSLSVVDRGPSSKKYTIRGISSGLIEATTSAVGVYIDEMPVSAALNQPDIKLFDIERVEVLKGPQGTIYGEGSMGGTIKTITKKANLDKFSGKIDGTLSSTSKGGTNTKINGMVNIPLIDKELAVRIVAYNRDMSGYIDRVAQPDGQNVDLNIAFGTPPGTFPIFMSGPIEGASNINDENTSGGRISVLWQTNDKLAINASVIIQKGEHGGPPLEIAGIGDLKSNQLRDETIKDDITLSNLTFEYDLGWGDIVASSSYYSRELTEDLDASALGSLFTGNQITGGTGIKNYEEEDNFSEEVRLVTDFSGPLNFIGGIFYIDKKDKFIQSVSDTTGVITDLYNTFIAIGAFGPTPFIQNFSDALDYQVDTDITQKAFFLEADYELTEDLTATVGARFFNIKQSVNFENFALARGQGILEPRETSLTSISESGTTTKFNLAYAASDDLLFYVQAAEGFRSGGINTETGVPVDLIEYKSDTLWNYETGFKSTFLDNHLAMNASLFRIDWKDIQLDLPVGFSRSIINAGKAKVQGIEFDLSAYPTDGLEFRLSLGKLKSELAENTPEGDAFLAGDMDLPNPGFKGDRLPGVPEFNAALSADYQFPIASMSLDGFIHVDFTHTGNSFTTLNDSSADNHYKMHSYNLANVRVGISKDDWEVVLFVDNVNDTRAEVLRLDSVVTQRITRNRPRTVGVNARMTF